MFFHFFLYTVFLKSLNFCSVETLLAQLHCHMDYFIYWRHANNTHLLHSSFAPNFEFSSLVICILRSAKSKKSCNSIVFKFSLAKKWGSHGPPALTPLVFRPCSNQASTRKESQYLLYNQRKSTFI